MAYRFLKLYRTVDTDQRIIEEELKKLGEFIKHRASQNKDISYYTLTYMSGKDIDGYIIIEGEESRVEHEIELVIGFIESSLNNLSYKYIKKAKKIKQLPIPRIGNFF